MTALFLFHLRVGVRLAIRASAPLFCIILAWIMLQMYPAAAVAALAKSAFSVPLVPADIAPIALIAFVLPSWGAARLSLGLNGWMRHLPISSDHHRRGLAIALLTVELPLGIALGILAIVSGRQGLSLWGPAVRWAVVLTSGALTALPVRRGYLVFPVAVVSASLAVLGTGWQVAVSILLLLAVEAVAGPVRFKRPRKPWSTASSFLSFRIAWRALGFRILPALCLGLLVLGVSWLFISNNDLRGPLAAGASRFGGAMACVTCIAWLSEALAVRRPVWPLARSFPWSAARRVTEDASFLAANTMFLVLPTAIESAGAALAVMSLLPFLTFRAAAHMRRIPELRTGAAVFLAEGFCAAATLALLPWSAPLWLAATLAAFQLAKEAELNQKVTRWLDLHHAAAGDTSSWSES